MRLRSFDQEVRNLLASSGLGIPLVGNIYPVLKAGTASAEFWTRKFDRGAQASTIAEANGRLTSLQNDVVIITPESHSLTESLTISKNATHWVGASAPSFMNQRSRIGMSTTFTPMVSITGYGNSFRNLYLMHGTAVGDYVGVAITGSRNSFHNVHFAGPLAEAQASDANFRGVTVVAAETYFSRCTFGNFTRNCDEATALFKQGAGCGVTIFEDCVFLLRVTAGQTDPFFVELDNATDTGDVIFKRCTFVAQIGTPAVVFSVLGAGLGRIILDAACQFIGVAALADATDDSYILIPRTYNTTDDSLGLINVELVT
jgi:hypothetical protein